jgi:hypothetical protein
VIEVINTRVVDSFGIADGATLVPAKIITKYCVMVWRCASEHQSDPVAAGRGCVVLRPTSDRFGRLPAAGHHQGETTRKRRRAAAIPHFAAQLLMGVAPAVGLEPTTKRLTAARSTTELRRSEGRRTVTGRRRGAVAAPVERIPEGPSAAGPVRSPRRSGKSGPFSPVTATSSRRHLTGTPHLDADRGRIVSPGRGCVESDERHRHQSTTMAL